jgi:DNA-binding SARP family transcriptional activator/tetratricopeptide (TPR) repeat protein
VLGAFPAVFDLTSGTVRIALFGQPRVVSEDGSREYPLPRKTLNVLGYLILQSKRPPTRDAVAFTLFPDEDEEKARGSLRRNLFHLLSALPSTDGGEPFVRADAERVAWNPAAPAHVDVFAFERAIAEGRDDEALAEYGGMLLPTLYDEWTTADRERLREAANDALARTTARDRSLRRFDAASASARRLLDDDPWREDIVRQLMSIRYEAGDRAGALATFAQFAARMSQEMHADPMAETMAVRDAILRGTRLATSEPTAPKRPSNDAALPFVGRTDPLTSAIERWHASADGSTGALFVAGEAGIGKSRFVAELARAIEREGGVTIVGETSAGGERHPYEAVIEALRSTPALRAGGAAGLDRLLDEHAQATLSDDRSARIRLFGTIQKAVRELARARPLAIVLEDLHWAGPATIDLIGYLIERLAAAPVLFVGTYRDDELPRAHPVRGLIAEVERSERVTRLALERLTGADAAYAIAGAAPPNLTDAALAAAVAWSEGVPLLLVEAVRDIAAGRTVGGTDLSGVVGERLARLSSNAQTALHYGAVLGARFELETLAAATGWRENELVDALAPSMELGLIRVGARSRGLAFAFSHHVIHAATLACIPEVDRAPTHAFVARALRTLFTGGDRALEIAQHYAAAGDARHAAEQYAAGARYALDVYANADARAAATLGMDLTTTAERDRELRYDLIATRERALARMAASDEWRRDAEFLCELAGEDELRLCDGLERLIVALRNDKVAQRAAVARLGSLAETSGRAAALFEKAVATEAFFDGDFRTASAAAVRASRHFDALAEREASLRMQLLRVSAHFYLGDPMEAAEVVATLRPAAEACADLSLRMDFYFAAATTGSDGRRDLALADAGRSLECALLIGDRFAEAKARLAVGWAAGLAGDGARALHEYEQAVDVCSDIGDMLGVAGATLNLASARGWFGDAEGALRLLDELEALGLDQPWITLQGEVHRGMTLLRAGRLAMAERWFLSARAHAKELGTGPFAAHIHACLAEIHARCGRLPQACLELDAARVELEQLDLHVAVAQVHALAARVHAELLDVPAARGAIAAAVATAGDIPSLELSAKFYWDLAAVSELLGDAAAAGEFARKAARTFADEALSIPPDLAEAYGRMSWNIAAFAYLFGREVSVKLAG